MPSSPSAAASASGGEEALRPPPFWLLLPGGGGTASWARRGRSGDRLPPTPPRCRCLGPSQSLPPLCRPPGASLCSSNGRFGYRFLLELGVEGGCGVGLCWNGIWGAAAEGCGACAAHLPPPHTHTGRQWETWSCFSLPPSCAPPLPLSLVIPVYPPGSGAESLAKPPLPAPARAHR